MEQQLPFGQLPQTVFLFEAPHVPSVVTAAVAVDCGGIVAETPPITGSPVADGAELGDVPSVQPF